MQDLESDIAKALVELSKPDNSIVKRAKKHEGYFTANDLALKMNYHRKGGEPNPSKARMLLLEMERRNLVKMAQIVKSDKGKGRTNELWKLV